MGIIETVSNKLGYYKQMEQKQAPTSYTLMKHMEGALTFREVPHSYAEIAKHGYVENPIVRSCVDLRAKGMGSLVWLLKDKAGNVITEHEVLELIKNPNPMHSSNDFFAHHQIHKIIGGQAFMRAVKVRNVPVELHLLRPDRVEVVEGKFEMPEKYKYQQHPDGVVREFPVNPATGESDVLRSYFCDPISDIKGSSPLFAAMANVQLMNEGTKHNVALMKNGAKVSAILSYTEALGEEARKRLEQKFDEKHAGVDNAGKWIISDGSSFQYQNLANNNQELDYVNSASAATRNIASALGVPLPKLGFDTTYANAEAAELSFWTDTLLSEADSLASGLTRWLLPMFGLDGYSICYDKDAIDALEPLRRQKYVKLQAVSFLTDNEKRAEVGFDEIDPEELKPTEAKPEADPATNENGEPVKPNNDPLDVEGEADPEQGKKNIVTEIETKSAADHVHTIDSSVKNGTTSEAGLEPHTHTYTIGAKHTSVTQGHRHEI